MTYSEWVATKIQEIVKAFEGGEGYGDIFESQYLVYLECLVASRGRDPTSLWDSWRSRIRSVAALSKGDTVQGMNRYLRDRTTGTLLRTALVTELESFRQRWCPDGPPVSEASKVEVQNQEPPRSPEDSKEEAEILINLEQVVAPKAVSPENPLGDTPPKLGTGRPERKSRKQKSAETGNDLFDLFGSQGE
jgi:hypothetical protein